MSHVDAELLEAAAVWSHRTSLPPQSQPRETPVSRWSELGGDSTITNPGTLPVQTEVSMSEKVSALLIYERPVIMAGLQLMLESHAIEVQTARSCGDAPLRLWADRPPHLVFTETQLLDGIWADVLSMTRRSRLPINVIVVSRLVDLNLYIQVLERGAFDFIVPPFEVSELEHVIRCAADNILARRAVQQMDGAAAGAASLKESAPQEEICLIDDDL